MIDFQYRRVGAELFKTLVSKLSSGRNVALLSHRYGGKRYTARRIARRLKEMQHAGQIVELNLHASLNTEVMLGRAIGAQLGVPEAKVIGIFDGLDRFVSESGKPLYVLAPNLDVLPHTLVQHFLQGVRVRTEQRKLVVLLGGDQHFREFVYGPNSELNIVEQFMLTGFDRDEFDRQVEQYERQVSFGISGGAKEALWLMTGGTPILMRGLIARAAEARARGDETGYLQGEEVERLKDFTSISSNTARQFFAHCNDALIHEPGCRHLLEDLLDGRNPTAPLEPCGLELAGVAVREVGQDGSVLRMSSPMAETYLRTHYTQRRLADIMALQGDWPGAWERLARVPPVERIRPDTASDRNQIESVVHALVAELASVNDESTAKAHFYRAIYYLLGFTEFSHWSAGTADVYPSKLPDDPLALDIGLRPIPGGEVYRFTEALRRPRMTGLLMLELAEPWGRQAVAATVMAAEGGADEIVVVSDITIGRSISQDRLRLSRQLIQAYASAVTRIRQVGYLKRLNEQRLRRGKVFGAVLSVIDQLDPDHSDFCRRIAAEVRELEYRRVLICLVNSRRDRIIGICDDSDQYPSVDVAKMTNYLLCEPTKDIQPFIIASRMPFVTAKAADEELANPKVVQIARQRGLAIVPMLDADGNAIGTIHVERIDGKAPNQEEVDFLIKLGKRMASVLSHTERTALINQALDKLQEPIAIIDPSKRWRYANSAAENLLGIPLGWRRWHAGTPLASTSCNTLVLNALERTLQTQPRGPENLAATEIRDLVATGDRFHLDAAPLRDVSGEVFGTILHLREFTPVHGLVEAIGGIIRAGTVEPALEAVLQAMARLGSARNRIYLIKTVDGQERLVSYRATGLSSSCEAEFNDGKYLLARRSSSHHSWRCIERGFGQIFKWDLQGVDGGETFTRNGLSACIVTEPEHDLNLGKKPGDYWIDLPLFDSTNKPIGKLAANISETLDPQRFWILQLFAALVAVIIETFRTNEEKLTQEGYRKSLATVAHHLLNRVMALDTFHYQYEEAETDPGRLPDLNKRFRDELRNIDLTVRRARDFLLTPKLNVRRFRFGDLRSRIQTHGGISRLLCPGTPECDLLEVDGDLDLLTLVVTELVDNAEKAVRNTSDATITLAVETGLTETIISVSDNGPGLPPEIGRLFEDFYSVWPKQKAQGTGLGLGWARRVVEAHYGSLSGTNVLGGGARFDIRLRNGKEGTGNAPA